MKKHPTTIEGFDGTIEALAQRVGRMRYDKVAEFLDYFGKELKRQANGDRQRGRVKLADILDEMTETVKGLRFKMERIFALCKPFMKDEMEDE